MDQEKRNGNKGMRTASFISRPISLTSSLERLQFVIDFVQADLTKEPINDLRSRLKEFLGYQREEIEISDNDYELFEFYRVDISGLSIRLTDYDCEGKLPSEFTLDDFVQLQSKLKPLIKVASHKPKGAITFREGWRYELPPSVSLPATFELNHSLEVLAVNTVDAFLLIFLLLLSRRKESERLWRCYYCENIFYRTKPQKFCKSCKARADKDRVKNWRREKFIKDRVISMNAQGKTNRQISEGLSLDIRKVNNILKKDKNDLEN